MASGHPQYGNYNDVPALDFGQDGGTLQTAGQARCTLRITEGSTDVLGSKSPLPEVQTVFESITAFGGQAITLTGIIWADTNSRMDTIEANIRSYERGVLTDASGGRTLVLTRIKATKLTSPSGRTIGLRAHLKKYLPRGPRKHGQQWGAIQEFAMIFEVLD